MVRGWFPDLCVASVARSIDFYRALLGLDVLIDHGWYAELGVGGRTALALVEHAHETIPEAVGWPPLGVLLSFEVDDADVVYAAAIGAGCPVLVDLTSELGQRHFMILDTDGAVVDVIERIPLTCADKRRLLQLRRDGTPD
jgi:catechol 2,3-dioxygenase-like lactoylglutathione lyase family enzyme